MWPILISMLLLWLLVVLLQIPGETGFSMIFVAPLGILVVLVAAVAFTIYFLVRSRPRRAASAALAVIVPALCFRPLVWSSQYVHLALTAGFGAAQLGGPYRSFDNRLTVYDWSVGFAGSPATFLIHDPTDRIALPPPRRIGPAPLEVDVLEECSGKARPLLAHYYVCTID